ncbi:MAG: response regulator [Chloroflexota bacterium]|nr:response regulator [Chloroflexota bacterium]
MNPEDFVSEFRLEAIEKLDVISAELLRLERDVTDPQPVREMFLAAHTIKGGAAMLRWTDVEALAHALEDLLSSFREQQRTLDATTADLLFQALDALRALITSGAADAIGAEIDPRIQALAARLRGGPAPPPAAGPRQALIVDDSATVRELHAMLAQDAGYDTHAVEDGELALAHARARPFELVLAGVGLRRLNGFELVRSLRALPEYAGASIILVSADTDPTLAARAAEAGATMLLRKGSLHDHPLTAALSAR